MRSFAVRCSLTSGRGSQDRVHSDGGWQQLRPVVSVQKPCVCSTRVVGVSIEIPPEARIVQITTRNHRHTLPPLLKMVTLIGFLFSGLLGSLSAARADNINRPSLERVARISAERDYIAPAWSPTDPDLIACSRQGYAGIYLMSVSTGEVRELTGDLAAGYHFVWMPNGEYLVYRAKRDRINSVIEAVNINTRRKTTLSPPGAHLGLPALRGHKSISYTSGDKLKEQQIPEVSTNRDMDSAKWPVAYQMNDRIFVDHGDRVRQISQDDGRYYTPLMSPDRSRVVFEEISRGLFVAEIDRSTIIHIGAGSNPDWSPDGSRLVYEVTADDGRNIVSSELYLFEVATRQVSRLTSTQMIERRPRFSPDGTKIIFDAAGAIYIGWLSR